MLLIPLLLLLALLLALLLSLLLLLLVLLRLLLLTLLLLHGIVRSCVEPSPNTYRTTSWPTTVKRLSRCSSQFAVNCVPGGHPYIGWLKDCSHFECAE